MDDRPASWCLYFPEEPFSLTDRKYSLIRLLCEFLLKEEAWSFISQIKMVVSTRLVLPMDFGHLCNASDISDLSAAMGHQPTECMGCLGAALYEVLFEGSEHDENLVKSLGSKPSPSKICVRVFNVESSVIAVRAVQSDTIGKLVTVKGTVIRLLPTRPVITLLDFSCSKCGDVQTLQCTNGRIRHPTSCSSRDCKSRSFQVDPTSVVTEDWQKVRIQELLAVSQQDSQAGGTHTLEVELSQDCVNSCKCGDIVSVVGFARAVKADASKFGAGLSLLYIEALSVRNCSALLSLNSHDRQATQVASHIAASDQIPGTMPDMTLKDLHFIVTFVNKSAPNQLPHLIRSLCPSILGHEMVKAGIILSLIGGVSKREGNASNSATRGDIHIMLLGDPGLGKSQLLRAAAAAAPRGLYVCSNTTSSAGLTVSVVKDSVTGDFAFEAGSLVTADKGVCCLDEFDKMRSEHKPLLEAMEQQEVSIAKAGLTASLPARTTVIAAANPVGGVYNRARTVQENMKLSTALLSRFDLTFVLLDKTDEATDQLLSGHVMTLHSGRQVEQDVTQRLTLPSHKGVDARETLKNRVVNFQCGNPLPMQLLRKYIAYTKQFCHPILSDEAKAVLKAFYLEIRRLASATPGLAVNARQLESLIRLAEARARVDLREHVTKDDAEDAVELMRYTLRDFFHDGQPPVIFKSRGNGMQKEGRRFVQALKDRAGGKRQLQFSLAEMHQVADEIRLEVHELKDLIDMLNESCDLLKKGPNTYTVNFA